MVEDGVHVAAHLAVRVARVEVERPPEGVLVQLRLNLLVFLLEARGSGVLLRGDEERAGVTDEKQDEEGEDTHGALPAGAGSWGRLHHSRAQQKTPPERGLSSEQDALSGRKALALHRFHARRGLLGQAVAG